MSESERHADIAIVGAGAAGLATAILAARSRPDLTIVALDSAKKLGAKILVSGGGRCNVTNARVTVGDFYGGNPNIVKQVLRSFTERETVEFFREIGVALHEEPLGKLFPDTNSAKTVVDALLREAGRVGVGMMTGQRVEEIAAGSEGDTSFRLRVSERDCTAKRIVLATGGLSLPKTGSDGLGLQMVERLGHSIVPTTPGLAPLILDGDFHAGLAGVSHDAQITIRGPEAKPVRIRGSLLWTHFGVSGPVALDASRFWHRARVEKREVNVSLSFLPQHRFETAEALLLDAASGQPRMQVATALAAHIPARVAEAVLNKVEIKPSTPLAHLSREARRRLILALQEFPLPVRDSRGYAYAEVTAGGVPLDEIDPATMRSRRCPGLYLVGEILDADARIGGFNFQWAWSTAAVAARGLASDIFS